MNQAHSNYRAISTRQVAYSNPRAGSRHYRSFLIMIVAITIIIASVGTIAPIVNFYPPLHLTVSLVADQAAVEKMRDEFMMDDLASTLAMLGFSDFQNAVWAFGVPPSRLPPPNAARAEHVDALLAYISQECADNLNLLVNAAYKLGVESVGSMRQVTCSP